MMAKIARYQLPDGRIARFEVGDDTTPEEANSIGAAHFASTPSASEGGGNSDWGAEARDRPQEPRSTSEEFLRQLGLTARYGLQGASGTIGMAGDALNTGINKVAGTNLGMPSKAIQQFADENLPKPEGALENAVGLASTVAAGAFDPAMGGIAGAIKGMTPSLYEAPLAARDIAAQTLREGQAAGYKTLPSEAKTSNIGRVLEYFSGPRANENNMRNANVLASDALARRAAGFPEGTGMSSNVMNRAMQDTEGNIAGAESAAPGYYGWLKSYRDNQALLDQQQQVGNALIPGTGHVDPHAFNANAPGDLGLIGRMANASPSSVKSPLEPMRKPSLGEHIGSASMGASVLGAASTGNIPALAAAVGWPLARVAARKMLMSDFGQGMFAAPATEASQQLPNWPRYLPALGSGLYGTQ